jgi:hypothetical protein
MSTLFDHISTKDGPAGRVYVTKEGERYFVDSYSLTSDRMKIDTGCSRRDEHILLHLRDEHVVSLTRDELKILAEARKDSSTR